MKDLEGHLLESYVNTFDWEHKWDAKESPINFSAKRHVYELIRPITQGEGRLKYYNLYPADPESPPYR